MDAWLNDAKQIDALEVEICFLIQDEFYFGPDRADEVQRRELVEPLESPDIERHVKSMVRTREAAGHEAELAKYYLRIVQLGQKHRRTFNEIRQYFWLRLWIWNSDEQVHLGFPWYDTYSEFENFFDQISVDKSGEVFWDRDQGWELQVQSLNGEFYARLRDPDDDETHVNVRFRSELLLEQVALVRARSEEIIRKLAAAVGDDVWTRRIDDPAFMRAEPAKVSKSRWKFW